MMKVILGTDAVQLVRDQLEDDTFGGSPQMEAALTWMIHVVEGMTNLADIEIDVLDE